MNLMYAHPTEDTFAPLHSPEQEARTTAALDRHTVAGNVVLGAGRNQEWNEQHQKWELTDYMPNTGKPRAAIDPNSAVAREAERKHKLAPVQQIGGLKIYLAGPMSGVPHFNFPAFYAAAKALRQHGHEVFNPAEADVIRHGGVDLSLDNVTGDQAKSVADHGFSLRDALRDDTHYICTTANAIAMLPGWEQSKGARAEHALACALGHQILYLGGFYA